MRWGYEYCSLSDMLGWYQQKYAVTDLTHVLYSLAYFDDADRERMPRMFWDSNWRTIKKTIAQWVQDTWAHLLLQAKITRRYDGHYDEQSPDRSCLPTQASLTGLCPREERPSRAHLDLAHLACEATTGGVPSGAHCHTPARSRQCRGAEKAAGEARRHGSRGREEEKAA